jgi:hypothetical protein
MQDPVGGARHARCACRRTLGAGGVAGVTRSMPDWCAAAARPCRRTPLRAVINIAWRRLDESGRESTMPCGVLASLERPTDWSSTATHEGEQHDWGKDEKGTRQERVRAGPRGTPGGARDERDVLGHQAERKRRHSHGVARTVVPSRTGHNSGARMVKQFHRVDQHHHVVIVSRVPDPRDPAGVWRTRITQWCKSHESADEHESEDTPAVDPAAVGTPNRLDNPKADDRDPRPARQNCGGGKNDMRSCPFSAVRNLSDFAGPV